MNLGYKERQPRPIMSKNLPALLSRGAQAGRRQAKRAARQEPEKSIGFTSAMASPSCQGAVALMGSPLSGAPATPEIQVVTDDKQPGEARAYRTANCHVPARARAQQAEVDASRHTAACAQHDHVDMRHLPQTCPVDGQQVAGAQFTESRNHDLTRHESPAVVAER